MPTYIGAYGWYIERFYALIIKHAAVDRTEQQAMLSAINKLLFLDMMIASKVYPEAKNVVFL